MQLSELKKAMKGVVIVQTTPFNKDGSLDLEGMRANTSWLLERTSGKDFIFTPLGTTGEFFNISDDECKAVIKMVAEETKGKGFGVFDSAEFIGAICAKGCATYTRKQLDGLTNWVKRPQIGQRQKPF